MSRSFVAVFVLASLAATLIHAQECPNLNGQPNFVAQRFSGLWYVLEMRPTDLAHPVVFDCMTTTITPDLTGTAATIVVNGNYGGTPATLSGNGNQIDEERPWHWTTTGLGPDTVYEFYVKQTNYNISAAVTTCNPNQDELGGFILSRTPTLPANEIAYLETFLEQDDVMPNEMVPINHIGCP